MNEIEIPTASGHVPWNKGKLLMLGQKSALTLREVWTIRTSLHMAGKTRELALFNLAINSKRRGCDLVRLKVSDVMHGDRVLLRAALVQQKTKQVVRFELTEPTQGSGRVGHAGGTVGGRLSLPQSPAGLTAPLHPPVRANRQTLDHPDRGRPPSLRHPLPAKDQGDTDLP
jgi:hypothetical protein